MILARVGASYLYPAPAPFLALTASENLAASARSAPLPPDGVAAYHPLGVVTSRPQSGKSGSQNGGRRSIGEGRVEKGEAMSKRGLAIALLVLLCAPLIWAQTFGVRKRMPRPDEFGNVVMDQASTEKDIAPVVFQHWLHRAKYTCRLCHVDLGFAMVANETGVRESDNEYGLYCGSCHNGEIAFASKEQTAKGGVKENCVRCHSLDMEVTPKYDFFEVVKDFPKARFGNRVDWMVAEDLGLIHLQDELPGISITRKPLVNTEERSLNAKAYQMPDIIFSHEKHTVWNGCELCHPQIFGVKRGDTTYHMQDIFSGMYCGACHGPVAFTTQDCQLCHSQPVT